MNYLKKHGMKMKNNPWKPVLWYALFGVSWILFSDTILGFWVYDQRLYELIQTFKGISYVFITAGLLYLFIRIDAKEVYRKAYYDELTDLKNRLSFDGEIQRMIDRKQPFRALLLDVNNFKHLNELHGYVNGDIFLANLGRELCHIPKAKVYRWWGDQFFVIDLEGKDCSVETSVNKIVSRVSPHWPVDDTEFDVSLSIGSVSYPEDGNTLSELNRKLDIALYKSKSKGLGQYQSYDETLGEEVQYLFVMKKEMTKAIEENKLELYCQPIYDLQTNVTKSYEVLLRWFHENEIFQNIGNVIEAAEKTNQMDHIDKWVVKTLFKTILEHPELAENRYTINLSSQSFNSKKFVKELIEMTNEYHVDASRFTLEITEHSLVEDFDSVIQTMKCLKDVGFRIALDDFGTMYSSLSYLSKLPIDVLKIDKSYIDGLLNKSIDTADTAIVSLIVKLGLELSMDVVGEGIETLEQNDRLKAMGCTYGQGYYYAKPMSIENLFDI